jgi:hypothetical protein
MPRGALRVLALVIGLGALAAPAAAADLVIGVRSEPVSLDPHFSVQPPDLQVSLHFFDALVVYDDQQRLHPGLAESWAQVDDRTWEFKLRQGVLWQDGSPFTADDVLFSFDRTGKVEGASNSPLRFYLAGGKTATKVDDHTIRISTPSAYVLTAEDLALSPHRLQAQRRGRAAGRLQQRQGAGRHRTLSPGRMGEGRPPGDGGHSGREGGDQTRGDHNSRTIKNHRYMTVVIRGCHLVRATTQAGRCCRSQR